MRIRNRKSLRLIEFMVCAVLLFMIPFNMNGAISRLVAVTLLALNIVSIIKVHNSLTLTVIYASIGYCNYSICVANYLSKINSFFTGYADTASGVAGLNVLFAFSVLLFLAAPYIQYDGKRKQSLLYNNRHNTIITLAALVILLFIWLFGYTRPSAVGMRGSPSPIFEYSIIFIIIAFYFAGTDRVLIGATVFVGLMFAALNFLYAGRATGVQIIIVLGLVLFADRIRYRWVLPVGLMLFIAMSAIGQLRGSLFTSGLDIGKVLSGITRSKVALSTAYSSYFTSMTFIETMSFTGVIERFSLFVRWALSVFLGGGRIADSNLSTYTRQWFVHYYGGVLPYYAWFYLGVPGLALLAGYLRALFSRIGKCNQFSGGLIRCVSIYVAATCLRWYLYSPSQITRGILLFALAYFACYCVDCVSKKKRISLNVKMPSLRLINIFRET